MPIKPAEDLEVHRLDDLPEPASPTQPKMQQYPGSSHDQDAEEHVEPWPGGSVGSEQQEHEDADQDEQLEPHQA
jgi:hypothetical protein